MVAQTVVFLILVVLIHVFVVWQLLLTLPAQFHILLHVIPLKYLILKVFPGHIISVPHL